MTRPRSAGLLRSLPPPDRYRLGNVSVQTTMGSSMPATAAVVIQAGEGGNAPRRVRGRPIDATFNVISPIVSRALI